MDLLLEKLYDVVFALQHVGQVAHQRGKAIVGLLLGLDLLDDHTTLQTLVSSFAVCLLVLYYIHSFDVAPTVDARHLDVRTHGLVLLYLRSYTLRFAAMVSLALYWLKEAVLVMLSYFHVVKLNVAPHEVVSALESQLLQLLFDLFLAVEELWLLALHGAHARLLMKLFETLVMESLLALLALYRINQDGLAKRTKVLLLELVLGYQVLAVKRDRDAILLLIVFGHID